MLIFQYFLKRLCRDGVLHYFKSYKIMVVQKLKFETKCVCELMRFLKLFFLNGVDEIKNDKRDVII